MRTTLRPTLVTTAAAAAALAFLSLPSGTHASGSYPCSTSADCVQYSKDGNPISELSECVADPVNPEYGYCGYAGAKCQTAADCDYGTCQSGTCSGYVGTPCTEDLDCLAFSTCAQGVCGGGGSSCLLGNGDCLTNVCDASNVEAPVCTYPPDGGMPDGSGCSTSSNCASQYCNTTTTYTCAAVSDPVFPPGASQNARMKARRHLGGHGHDSSNPKRSFSHQNFYRGRNVCPLGQTACTIGSSYECIDTLRSLESCGGCPAYSAAENANKPVGTDCTALANVDEVLCSNGRCMILSCIWGSRLSENASSCI